MFSVHYPKKKDRYPTMFNRFKPVLPGIILVYLWMFGNNKAQAQLTIGPSGMFIKSTTTVSVDNLVLQPSTDLPLSDVIITHTDNPVPGINGNSIRPVYEFSQPVSFTGTVGIYYAENELNGNAEPVLALVYQNASDNNWVTITGTSVDATNNYLTQSLTTPPIIKITATSNGVILPIVLRNYAAREVSGKVKLEWQTSMEQDIDRFDIERSTDGQHFTLLTTVKGANVATGAKYTAYDHQPVPGYNYYRLLQYDRNGHKNDLGIRTVLIGAGNNMTVTTYPNPTSQAINLRLQTAYDEKLHVTLFTAQGARYIMKMY